MRQYSREIHNQAAATVPPPSQLRQLAHALSFEERELALQHLVQSAEPSPAMEGAAASAATSFAITLPLPSWTDIPGSIDNDNPSSSGVDELKVETATTTILAVLGAELDPLRQRTTPSLTRRVSDGSGTASPFVEMVVTIDTVGTPEPSATAATTTPVTAIEGDRRRTVDRADLLSRLATSSTRELLASSVARTSSLKRASVERRSLRQSAGGGGGTARGGLLDVVRGVLAPQPAPAQDTAVAAPATGRKMGTSASVAVSPRPSSAAAPSTTLPVASLTIPTAHAAKAKKSHAGAAHTASSLPASTATSPTHTAHAHTAAAPAHPTKGRAAVRKSSPLPGAAATTVGGAKPHSSRGH